MHRLAPIHKRSGVSSFSSSTALGCRLIGEAADGEPEVTVVAVRRVDITSIEGEVVRVASTRDGRRGPTVAVKGCIPQRTAVDMDVPAAHEVKSNKMEPRKSPRKVP